MPSIIKKEFDHYFENYAKLLDREVHLYVLCELEEGDVCRKMEYDATLKLMNEYGHLSQDFYPRKFFRMWLRKELGCIDDIFEKLEKEYKGKELPRVKELHGKRLLSFVEWAVGPELEELKKGTSDYEFYKNMRQKGEAILEQNDEVGG